MSVIETTAHSSRHHARDCAADSTQLAISNSQAIYLFESPEGYTTPGTSLTTLGGAEQCGEQPLENTFSSTMSAVTLLINKLSDLVTKLIDSLKATDPSPTDQPSTATPPPTDSSGETTPTADKPTSGTPGSQSFAEKEKTVLKPDANGKVSELELRRGVVVYQLYQKDSALEATFEKYYAEAQKNGDTPTNALKSALSQLVSDKKLEKSEADWVYSLSFRAAQFEGEDTGLSTSTNSSHGLALNAAIKSAEATLAGIQSGNIQVKPLSV
jgi:hypothetical protein